MKNHLGNRLGIVCVVLSAFSLPLASAVAAEIPDANPEDFHLNAVWPAGGLDVLHPPYFYDVEPDDIVSKATFRWSFIRSDVMSTSTGFFIDTERDDNKVCAITAGHSIGAVLGIDEEAFDRKNFPLPIDTIVALNFRRVHPQRQQVSFFGNRIPKNAMQVVRAIQKERVNPGQTPAKFYQDMALLLIDTTSLKGRTMMSTLPYAFAAKGSHLEGTWLTKGHPKGWPLHRGVIHTVAPIAGQYSLFTRMTGDMGPGASGGPLAYSDGTVTGVMAAEAIFPDTAPGRYDGVAVSFLTPLIATIEQTCKQSKTPRYVYKTSTLVPMAAFEHGFVPPGANRDVVAHVSGASCRGAKADTAFISTTKSQAVAYERALAYASAYPGKEVYVYRIRADEKFYSAKDSLRDSLKHFEKTSASMLTTSKADLENELLFVDDVTFAGLPTQNIAGAFMFKKENDGLIHHQQISNVNFKPAQTKASTFSYVGPDSSGNQMNVTWMTKVGSAAPNGSCLMPGSIPEDARHFPAEVIFNMNIHKDL